MDRNFFKKISKFVLILYTFNKYSVLSMVFKILNVYIIIKVIKCSINMVKKK